MPLLPARVAGLCMQDSSLLILVVNKEYACADPARGPARGFYGEGLHPNVDLEPIPLVGRLGRSRQPRVPRLRAAKPSNFWTPAGAS